MLTESDTASALDISAVTMDFAFCDHQTAYMTKILDLPYDASIFDPIAGNASSQGVPKC